MYSCSHCGHRYQDELDLSVPKKKKKNIDLHFEEDRKKYCLPETDGEEYLRNTESMKELLSDWDERDKNKDIYDAIEKIEKLKVSDLEKRPDSCMVDSCYTHLHFKSPEIEQSTTLYFTVQDDKSYREEYNSKKNLKKIIQKELGPTNWRLMSEKITYRMGILQGRLRGYDGDESLVNLIKRKSKSSDK